MTVESAVERTRVEIQRNSKLRIVAISGPGEPLANPETFEILERIRREHQEIAMCLSTNGLLLADYIDWLTKVNVETITVSMSTANISTAAKIYEWARFDDLILKGEMMGSRIVAAQLKGINKAADAGIHVKINSILIPEINMQDIIPLASVISKIGAVLHNIIPLVPNDKFISYRAPSTQELHKIRNQASIHLKQFAHCKQCRSDVMGIPGCDTVL